MKRERLLELAGVNESKEVSQHSTNEIIDGLILHMLKNNFTIDDVERVCVTIKNDFKSISKK